LEARGVIAFAETIEFYAASSGQIDEMLIKKGDSIDEDTIIAETEMGVLVLRGENLHVNRLNLETGDLEIDGSLSNLSYEDSAGYGKGGRTLLGKLFR